MIIESNAIVLMQQNIDTDQIIPARFLKTVKRTGLGESLFYDWRYDEDGFVKSDSPFDFRSDASGTPDDAVGGCQIIIAGQNFGCGSSREHASWALSDYGIKAVISSGFADIFKTNALKNGIVLVELSAQEVAELMKFNDPITIDVENLRIYHKRGFSATFSMDPFEHYKLLNNVDEMDYLIASIDEVERYENAL